LETNGAEIMSADGGLIGIPYSGARDLRRPWPRPKACLPFLSLSLLLYHFRAILILPRLAALNRDDDLSHEIIISVRIVDTREEVGKKGNGGGTVMENPGQDYISDGDVLFASSRCRSLPGLSAAKRCPPPSPFLPPRQQ